MVNIIIQDRSSVGISIVRNNASVISSSYAGNQKVQIMINGLDDNLTTFVNFSREG